MGNASVGRAALPTQTRDELVGLTASTWVPVDVTTGHFEAIQALQLDDKASLELGRSMGGTIRGVLASGISATLRAAGFSPWLLLQRADKMLSLLAQGAAIEVCKQGPKDATLELRGIPMYDSRFFQYALLGIVEVTFDLAGAKKHYVRLLGSRSATQSVCYALQWV